MIDSFFNKLLQDSSFSYAHQKIILDSEGNPVDYIFLEVNAAFERWTGLKQDEIENKRASEVITRDHQDSFTWVEFFGNLALTGGKAEFDEYYRQLNRWFRISVSSPEHLHFVTISFDITEKKLADITLRESEEKNRQYIENAPDGIFIIDAQGRFREVNPATGLMLDYSREELLVMSFKDIVPPEELDAALQSFERLREDGREQCDLVLRQKDGTLINVALDSVILPNGLYMAFAKDVSWQKRIEQEKERYYVAFQAIAQPLLLTDPEGKILEINRAFSDMYGYKKLELIGQTPNCLNPGRDVYHNLGYSDKEYEALFAGLWQAVTDPAVGTWEGVVVNRRRDNSLAWVNLLVTGVFSDKGKLVIIIGLPIDISKSRQTEDRSRIQMYQTIADLAELRDDDTGNHMNRVGLFSKLLAKACGMSEKYCNDIEMFAPMHDIGKVGILDSILRAPRKLSSEEFEIMKTHTVLGHNIVKGKKEFEMAAEITLGHHERYNGSGYPSGLAGPAIPLSARITAIADVYDALRSKRSYKKPWSHERSVEEIVKGSGSHFDPELIELFTEMGAQFESVFRELTD